MPTIDNWRSTLMRAAVNCPHTIVDQAVTLHRTNAMEGNALAQLADRLAEAVKPLLDERDRLVTDAQNCKELIWALARELKCLPSTFSDANGHVLKAAIALNAERDRLAAEVEALRSDANRAVRGQLLVGDCLHHQILAMRAAAVASELESPEIGMRWIINTLAGPGHLPNLDEAHAIGGAQAMFDKEMAEHEAFREANPAPAIDAARGIKEGGAV